jgi:threonyl-tRNA synthetase
LKLTLYILNSFGFKNFEVNLSVRDPENKEKFIGRDEDWERAEGELKNVLAEAGFKDFVYDVGGAVFYGPKIDVKVKDALGRPWQLSTIQFDFNLPARFNMTYQGADGQEHTPFMIHRALLGSLERFLGVLIEHYGGAFPVWLSPVQIKIISVSEKHIDYCDRLKEEFKEADLRSEIDDKNETVDNKIRKALEEKVPYILVVGDKEMNADILTIRDRGEAKTRETKKKEFLEEVEKKIKNKE